MVLIGASLFNICPWCSARPRHPAHPHGGELHGGARRGHAHAPRGAHGPRRRARRRLHAARARQGPRVRGPPAEEPGGRSAGIKLQSYLLYFAFIHINRYNLTTLIINSTGSTRGTNATREAVCLVPQIPLQEGQRKEPQHRRVWIRVC